jgi:hypothetical protein
MSRAPAAPTMLQSGQKDAFNAAMTPANPDPATARNLAFRSRPYGRMTDPFDLFTEVEKYQVLDVAEQITTPLLICDPAGARTSTASPSGAS